MLQMIFVLLVVYQIKHFVADFLLQVGSKFMLGKFKPGWDFVGPLAAHCGIHAIFTLFIVLKVNPSLWWLSLVDFGIHFIMDRIKAGPKYLGKYKSMSANEMIPILKKMEAGVLDESDRKQLKHNVYYYWSLGLDQMVHCLTHYFIIYMLVKDLSDAIVMANVGLLMLMVPFILMINVPSMILVFVCYKIYKRFQ